MAALAARAAASAQTTAYTGPLDNFGGKVNADSLDPVAWTRKRWESMPRRLRFQAANKRDAEAWQKKLRTKVVELLGGFPSERPPINAAILETRSFPAYQRETVIFESRPGLTVFGYLLLPAKPASTPPPVVLCIPGHGRGVDDVVGVAQDGTPRTDKSGYMHDFAIQLAEQGMAAFAIEPLGFGCRRDPVNRKRGLGQSSCQPSAGAALLFGETMIGWRVYDSMRALDWLETRKDVDAKRAGCMGISGGGTATLFTAAVDTRIKAALISGYLNSFRDSILSLSHCIDNYVPGILQWAEMWDVAGLIAPRPLAAESGEKDNIFPVAAARESFGNVKKVYQVFGAEDKTLHHVFNDGHVFNGEQGIPFLAKHL